MKALILSLAVLTLTTAAFANAEISGLKTFPITQAQLAEAHFEQEFNSGDLTVNYDEKKVTLVLNPKFECTSGRVCAMVMPNPKIIVLPIVSIDSGNCGATLISAQKDQRNRDGVLEQINITDNTTMFCRILLPYEGTASYMTSSVDRSTGETLTQTSKMILGGRHTQIGF